MAFSGFSVVMIRFSIVVTIKTTTNLIQLFFNYSTMCQKVVCSKCHKPTWSGCGKHIEAALAGVELKDRCQCPRS